MKILTLLPVSRLTYLDEVLESLINQSYEERTALLVVVDGDNDLYVKVHNKLASIPLNNVLCVKHSDYFQEVTTIPLRRKRIADIHNQMRGLISDDIDLVFSIEDDGILPVNALSWLVNDMRSYPAAGMVTGVELGRWGTPYVGAWTVDNFEKPTEIKSVKNKVGSKNVDEIDACGLYCALIDADLYKKHNFTSKNGLGPDINMALEFRQLGWKVYIDWMAPVTHLTEKNGQTQRIHATDKSVQLTMVQLDEFTWHGTGP